MCSKADSILPFTAVTINNNCGFSYELIMKIY